MVAVTEKQEMHRGEQREHAGLTGRGLARQVEEMGVRHHLPTQTKV